MYYYIPAKEIVFKKKIELSFDLLHWTFNPSNENFYSMQKKGGWVTFVPVVLLVKMMANGYVID